MWKKSTVSGEPTERKYIVDVVEDWTVILMEIDPKSGSIVKSCVHSNGRWHAGWTTENRIEQCIIESARGHDGNAKITSGPAKPAIKKTMPLNTPDPRPTPKGLSIYDWQKKNGADWLPGLLEEENHAKHK